MIGVKDSWITFSSHFYNVGFWIKCFITTDGEFLIKLIWAPRRYIMKNTHNYTKLRMLTKFKKNHRYQNNLKVKIIYILLTWDLIDLSFFNRIFHLLCLWIHQFPLSFYQYWCYIFQGYLISCIQNQFFYIILDCYF